MKKYVLKSSILAGLLSLFLACSTFCTGEISDITKPYLGEYECKSATYGQRDILEDFSYIVLDLKKDETFVLRYADKKGLLKGEQTGTYVYDKEKEKISLQIDGKSDWKREFPIQKGELVISLPIGGKTFTTTFQQK